MLAQHGPIPLHWMPSAVHSVFSTQNAQQAALAAGASKPPARRATTSAGHCFRARQIELPADSGTADNFRTDIWYRALVSKVTHWAELAEQNVGKLLLCSDNDISLLPGWVDALAWAFVDAGPVDVLFQREGGEDAFFAPFPYNSGFFLMNGSAALGRFWRQVAARTASERPFTGDQAVVNSLLMPRGWGDDDLRCDDPLGIRHAHFPPRLVRGAPDAAGRRRRAARGARPPRHRVGLGPGQARRPRRLPRGVARRAQPHARRARAAAGGRRVDRHVGSALRT